MAMFIDRFDGQQTSHGNILVIAMFNDRFDGQHISYGNILVVAMFVDRFDGQHISYGNILVMAMFILRQVCIDDTRMAMLTGWMDNILVTATY